jgi:hypothetical protein
MLAVFAGQRSAQDGVSSCVGRCDRRALIERQCSVPMSRSYKRKVLRSRKAAAHFSGALGFTSSA